MELRTPKRYRSGGKRERRLFGSLRWFRNLMLLIFASGAMYWAYNNQLIIREQVLGLQDDASRGIAGVQTAIPRQPTATPDVSNTLVEANSAYQTGNFNRAIELYEQVLAGAPNDVEAHYRLALLWAITSSLGDDEARIQNALDVSQRAIHAQPESPMGWTIRALALVWAGRIGEGIAYAQRALELDPNAVEAKAVLAEAYWRIERRELAVQNIQEAIDYLRTVGSADPETIALVFRTQGFIAERQLDREAAIEAYQIAREAAPYHSYIALELSYSYTGNGQTNEAIELLNRALDSNPRDTDLLFQIGLNHASNGNGQEAQQVFQRCIDLDSSASECYAWLGGLQFFAGSYAPAIVNLELAIENGTDDIEAWWQLGRAHAAMLRCDLAIPILREGYQLAANNADLQRQFAGGIQDCGGTVIDPADNAAPPVTPTPVPTPQPAS
ncbi:MAG: tetratricopeptide repeat protein [Anaerolineales bacterium]